MTGELKRMRTRGYRLRQSAAVIGRPGIGLSLGGFAAAGFDLVQIGVGLLSLFRRKEQIGGQAFAAPTAKRGAPAVNEGTALRALWWRVRSFG